MVSYYFILSPLEKFIFCMYQLEINYRAYHLLLQQTSHQKKDLSKSPSQWKVNSYMKRKLLKVIYCLAIFTSRYGALVCLIYCTAIISNLLTLWCIVLFRYFLCVHLHWFDLLKKLFCLQAWLKSRWIAPLVRLKILPFPLIPPMSLKIYMFHVALTSLLH